MLVSILEQPLFLKVNAGRPWPMLCEPSCFYLFFPSQFTSLYSSSPHCDAHCIWISLLSILPWPLENLFLNILTKIQSHLSWEYNTIWFSSIYLYWCCGFTGNWTKMCFFHQLKKNVFKILVIGLFNRHVKSRHCCIWITCSHCNVYRTSCHG